MATQSPAERVTADNRPSPLVDAIRDAIVDGEFAANQRLVESDLSERFGASRGNVRTALLQLTSEGLVERMQNRGSSGAGRLAHRRPSRSPRSGWPWRGCARRKAADG